MVYLSLPDHTYFVNTRVLTFRIPLVHGKDEEVVSDEFFDTRVCLSTLDQAVGKSLLDLLSVSSPPRSSFGFQT